VAKPCQARSPKINPPAAPKSFLLCSLLSDLISAKFADYFGLPAHTHSMIEAQTAIAPSFLASSRHRFPVSSLGSAVSEAEMNEGVIFLPQKWCKVNLTTL
jgi:hypothetical protein